MRAAMGRRGRGGRASAWVSRDGRAHVSAGDVLASRQRVQLDTRLQSKVAPRIISVDSSLTKTGRPGLVRDFFVAREKDSRRPPAAGPAP